MTGQVQRVAANRPEHSAVLGLALPHGAQGVDGGLQHSRLRLRHRRANQLDAGRPRATEKSTQATTPASRTAACARSASGSFVARGASTKTCLPA